jgi:phage terminase large subunit GpA-like protein
MFEPAVIRKFVEGVLSGVFVAEPDEEIWQWAERCMRIPANENADMAGQLWQSYYSPYVREVMEWVKRPGKSEMWIKKSSQVGITLGALLIVCWFVQHRGGGIGYAIDTLEEARRISKVRLQAWLRDNKILEEMGEDPEDISNLTYYLSGITVYMMGAQSGSTFQNKSTVLFILDELDEHAFIDGHGATSDLARDRCKVPQNSKILGFCKPGHTGLITKEHKKGTQEEIRFPFPCCGYEQALHWDNLVFSTDEFRDLADEVDYEKVLTGAYFKCESCADGRLLDHQKLPAMEQFQSVATNLKAPPGVRSMHIWDAYSAFVTFGQLGVEWLEAQGDPARIEKFIRSRRGLHFEQTGGVVTNQELLELRGAYKRGTCPPNVEIALYVMAVDIQDGFLLKATKSLYDKEGNIYVIDWGEFVSLEELEDFADIPLATPIGDLTVMCGLLDEGNDKEEVWRFHLQTAPRFYPVKGRGGKQVTALVAASKGIIDGQLVLSYHVDDYRFKWSLLNSLRRKHYSEKRQNNIARITFPEDVNADAGFLTELTNEIPVKVKNKFGVDVWDWKKKGPNDYWDTLKYTKAIWIIMAPALGMQTAIDTDETETPEAA